MDSSRCPSRYGPLQNSRSYCRRRHNKPTLNSAINTHERFHFVSFVKAPVDQRSHVIGRIHRSTRRDRRRDWSEPATIAPTTVAAAIAPNKYSGHTAELHALPQYATDSCRDVVHHFENVQYNLNIEKRLRIQQRAYSQNKKVNSK